MWMKPFAHRKQELSIETGCLYTLWKPSHYPYKVKILLSKRVTQRSPWSIKDESCSMIEAISGIQD